MRSYDDRRRDVESRLDALGEMSSDTDGDMAPAEATLTVADDLLDYLVAYCRLGPPRTIDSGRVVWRQASGRYREIAIVLKTKERRRLAAA